MYLHYVVCSFHTAAEDVYPSSRYHIAFVKPNHPCRSMHCCTGLLLYNGMPESFASWPFDFFCVLLSADISKCVRAHTIHVCLRCVFKTGTQTCHLLLKDNPLNAPEWGCLQMTKPIKCWTMEVGLLDCATDRLVQAKQGQKRMEHVVEENMMSLVRRFSTSLSCPH